MLKRFSWLIAIVVTLSVVGAAPASAQLGKLWDSLFGSDENAVQPDKGFHAFRTEARRIEDSFACSRLVERPGDEFSDLRRHCLIGVYGTARFSIYEPVGHEGLTKKIKFTWLDNQRPNAQGRNAPRHADRAEVRQAVRKMAEIYLPNHQKQLMDLFTRSQDGIVTEGLFVAVLAFQKRTGYLQSVIEIRDGNYEQLAGSEDRQGRPGYDKCLYILSNIPQLADADIKGEPIPERSDLFVSYFLASKKGEKFICEIHNSGYYRIRVSQKQGEAFKVLAHGNLGGN